MVCGAQQGGGKSFLCNWQLVAAAEHANGSRKYQLERRLELVVEAPLLLISLCAVHVGGSQGHVDFHQTIKKGS